MPNHNHGIRSPRDDRLAAPQDCSLRRGKAASEVSRPSYVASRRDLGAGGARTAPRSHGPARCQCRLCRNVNDSAPPPGPRGPSELGCPWEPASQGPAVRRPCLCRGARGLRARQRPLGPPRLPPIPRAAREWDSGGSGPRGAGPSAARRLPLYAVPRGPGRVTTWYCQLPQVLRIGLNMAPL